MRIILFVAVCFALGKSCVALAQELQPQVELMMTNLSKAKAAMNSNHCRRQDGSCVEAPPSICVFENYCSQLSRKAQEPYLFQDSEGYRIPNSAMFELAGYAEQCPKNPFPQARVDDPFIYPEKFMNEAAAGGKSALNRHQETLRKAQERAGKIFEETRQQVVGYLLAKRSSANASHIDNMIARVKSVRLSFPQMTGSKRDLLNAGCDSPNAWYSPSEHSITICPQFLNYPEAAFLWTLSHEFSHAFDPCHIAMDFSSKGALFPEWMDDFSSSRKKEHSAIASAKNPFKDVISCLQSAQSTGVAIPSKAQLIAEADQELRDFKKEAKDLGIEDLESVIADNKERKRIIHTHYDEFKACPQLTGRGHICESFADWMGAEILALKLSKISDSEKAREYALASQAVFLGTSCGNIRQSLLEKFKPAKKCSSSDDLARFNAVEKESLHHLSPSRRINRILFAKPEIKKALGCQSGEAVKPCH